MVSFRDKSVISFSSNHIICEQQHNGQSVSLLTAVSVKPDPHFSKHFSEVCQISLLHI